MVPGRPPTDALRALEPDDYARGHALFEARSDQREQVIDWLGARLAKRAGSRALSVLSVGCGDGSVDAALARRACEQAPTGARRAWTGIEPHPASAEAFSTALAQVDSPGLQARCRVARFEDVRISRSFDVVTFVHSLYYVDDLSAALRSALDLVARDGELLILHAPLGALNQLTAEVTTAVGGHPQPWTEQVDAALDGLAARMERTELDATVDLTDAAEADPALLDFTVQAALDPASRAWVLEQLDAIAEPGAGRRIAHPVTAYVVRPTGRGDTPA